jgi:hypothetical protein
LPDVAAANLSGRADREQRRRSIDDRILEQAALNYQHSRERLGKLMVECYVSNRFLVFPEVSEVQASGNDLMFVDVMTRNVEEDAKKLCTLIVDRRELLEAVTKVRSKPFQEPD